MPPGIGDRGACFVQVVETILRSMLMEVMTSTSKRVQTKGQPGVLQQHRRRKSIIFLLISTPQIICILPLNKQMETSYITSSRHQVPPIHLLSSLTGQVR